MKAHKYTIFYIVLILFSFTRNSLLAQNSLTDRIMIEFMKPGDKDAEARNYNLLPWPEEAKAAAYKAAEIWASYLEINVPIRVKFGWCDNIEPNAEGGSKYYYQYTDGYYYPLSLVNQLLGYDKNTDVVDIICVFKSTMNWYFGLEEIQQWYPDPKDPTISYSRNSIIPTMLHEICHGLGISSSMTIENDFGKWGGSLSGKAYIYDTFLCDKDGRLLIDTDSYQNSSKDLALALTSEAVYWNGDYATAANNGYQVKIHAPNLWKQGNSISHIATEYGRTINDLMSNGKGGVISSNGMNNLYTFTPGPIVLGMLQDIGWKLKAGSTDTEVVSLTKTKVSAHNGMVSIIAANIGDNVCIYEISGKMVYNGRVSSDRMDVSISGHGIYIVQVGSESFKILI